MSSGAANRLAPYHTRVMSFCWSCEALYED